MTSPPAGRRHIQDHDAAESSVPHWGYPSRVVPCVNDPGSCAYLDAVYWMHDVSMLYTFIMWAVIGGLLFIILAFRVANPRNSRRPRSKAELESQNVTKGSSFSRAWGAISAWTRRYLLPESLVYFFGHVTRLQIVILCAMLVYLLIFTLVGTVYKSWVTPIEDSPKFNTRTPLGAVGNRVGAFAYALTPLTVALSTRENILSLITGVPYQHFNFLHRWTGRIIFIQSAFHTIAWTIVQAKLYQPQPQVYNEFIVQVYIVMGIIAQILITFLYIFSIKRVIRWTGHEFFRKTHYVAGILYLGFCWGHWTKLACWMIASIGIVFLDRGCRLLRTLAIHLKLKDESKGIGFKAAESKITSFDDGDGGIVVRLEFAHQRPPWRAGQHFFLCFPELTVWQSHPFTPFPSQLQSDARHTYIIRCLKGETSRLPLLPQNASGFANTPVILTGPYGTPILDNTTPNILAIAGGTGISFALPLAAAAAATPTTATDDAPVRRVELIWVIRRARNIEWIQDELNVLLHSHQKNVTVRIFISREPHTLTFNTFDDSKQSPSPSSSSPPISASPIGDEKVARPLSYVMPQHPNLHVSWLEDHHPDMGEIVQEFVGSGSSSVAGGRVQVLGSGPAGMGRDLRAAVAAANDGGKVWRGEEGFDVDLYWDNRYM
ncbi:hypothetical protein AJ79_04879 [Helicocarpus griseus UAMH5409]|uniref:FAD-binding FR-type domain-containing protein n=1 Tax=Helicocarpus griseus UAMH5409 TaxID=1447875 RepID=A0A2B7XIF2_9EURO|nr:hypothetical protein AJ79_04879 [Helicocarpus griseus UAMH5409]